MTEGAESSGGGSRRMMWAVVAIIVGIGLAVVLKEGEPQGDEALVRELIDQAIDAADKRDAKGIVEILDETFTSERWPGP